MSLLDQLGAVLCKVTSSGTVHVTGAKEKEKMVNHTLKHFHPKVSRQLCSRMNSPLKKPQKNDFLAKWVTYVVKE